jgi:hypothetical protein
MQAICCGAIGVDRRAGRSDTDRHKIEDSEIAYKVSQAFVFDDFASQPHLKIASGAA